MNDADQAPEEELETAGPVLMRSVIRATCAFIMMLALVVIRLPAPLFAFASLAVAIFLFMAAFRPGGRTIGYVAAVAMAIAWAASLDPRMLPVLLPAVVGLGSVIVHHKDDPRILKERYGRWAPMVYDIE